MSMSSTSTITNISSTQRATNRINNHHTHRISNGAQACAACKYQRRKCAPDCILAPYFPHDRQKPFLNAHKLFGVSNITKIIKNLKPAEKDVAMSTIIYQSEMRAKDPVGGCFRIVQRLQNEIYYATQQLEFVLQQIAVCRAHQAAYQLQQQPQHHNNDDPTTSSSYEILQEFNDHQNYPIMPAQDSQGYFNSHQQQQQQQEGIINHPQLHENEDDVGGGEVLNHHPPPPQDNAIQDFQYSWNLQDSVWIPSKGSSNREVSSPVEGDDLCKDVKPPTDHGVNLGHEYVETTSFEREESFKFDQQAIEKSEMILKEENLALDEESEAFQQQPIPEHQIPEHDLRSAATLFTLTS